MSIALSDEHQELARVDVGLVVVTRGGTAHCFEVRVLGMLNRIAHAAGRIVPVHLVQRI